MPPPPQGTPGHRGRGQAAGPAVLGQRVQVGVRRRVAGLQPAAPGHPRSRRTARTRRDPARSARRVGRARGLRRKHRASSRSVQFRSSWLLSHGPGGVHTAVSGGPASLIQASSRPPRPVRRRRRRRIDRAPARPGSRPAPATPRARRAGPTGQHYRGAPVPASQRATCVPRPRCRRSSARCRAAARPSVVAGGGGARTIRRASDPGALIATWSSPQPARTRASRSARSAGPAAGRPGRPTGPGAPGAATRPRPQTRACTGLVSSSSGAGRHRTARQRPQRCRHPGVAERLDQTRDPASPRTVIRTEAGPSSSASSDSTPPSRPGTPPRAG